MVKFREIIPADDDSTDDDSADDDSADLQSVPTIKIKTNDDSVDLQSMPTINIKKNLTKQPLNHYLNRYNFWQNIFNKKLQLFIVVVCVFLCSLWARNAIPR